MATRGTQTINRAGVAPTYHAASAGGDRISPSPKTVVHIKNGSGASITATFVTPSQVSGDLPVGDASVVVPAGAERWAGPWDPKYFTDPTDNLMPITWSATATVTFAVVALP